MPGGNRITPWYRGFEFLGLWEGLNNRSKFLFRSEMGQNFWMAIIAWTTCFAVTVLVSLLTRRIRTDQELAGLVYSLMPKPVTDLQPWYCRPVAIGLIVLAAVILLNLIFW